MRIHVDWEDGGIGWDGPEILPDDGPPIEAEPNRLLPVLWEPFPAFLDISAWYAREESTLHPPGKEPGALVELRAHGESSPPAQWPTVVPSARTACGMQSSSYSAMTISPASGPQAGQAGSRAP